MNIPQEFEDVFRGVELTEDEIRTLTWITGWERRTVENLRSAIRKAQATAPSTLQAENKQLRAELEYEREHANAYYEECGQWEAENEKLRAELERVKEERDAVVESIPHECKTCVYHTVFFNGCTLDHDCTNPDGGCSNNYDRWQWRGIKED